MKILDLLLKHLPNAKIARGDHVTGGCPICGKDDKFYINYKKALNINPDNGKYVGSYDCKRGDHSGSVYEVFKHLGILNLLPNRIPTIDDYNHDFDVIPLSEEEDVLELIKTPINRNSPYKFNPDIDFLTKRGWTNEELIKYEVTQSNDYVYMIIKQNSVPVAYIGRSVLDATFIKEHNKSKYKAPIQKFKNSWGVDFGKILGGLDDILEETHTVIVVEGIFDKVAVDRKLQLYKFTNVKCVFTFGKSFKDYQVNILKKFTNVKNVIILYDSDALESSIKTANKIQNLFSSVKVASLENGDPEEVTTDELTTALRDSNEVETFFNTISLDF